MSHPPSLAQLCRSIDLLVLDVDGVLTDGRITYASDGSEIKSFHVRDGSALKVWHSAGKASAILTGRSSPVVGLRAAELGVGVVIQGAADKGAGFRDVLSRAGVDAARVCYVGDDVPDLAALRQARLPVAVADASPEVRQAAAYVTRTPGGCGAVREVIERVLRCQGLWPNGPG